MRTGADILAEATGPKLKRPWDSFREAVRKRLEADFSAVAGGARVTRCELDVMDPKAAQGFDPRVLPPFTVTAGVELDKDPGILDGTLAADLRFKRGWDKAQVTRWGGKPRWTVEAEIPRD